MVTRRHVLAALGATGAAATAAACSPSATTSDSSASDAGGSSTELVFRLWDEAAKPAYEKSLAAFTEQTGIDVRIDVVAWGDYWTKLPLDIASGDMADVYWMNSANYSSLQQSGNLLAIDDVVETDPSEWEQAVVDLYTRDGKLWGVPQIWDSIALFYNKTLVEEAGIDPTSLAFDPSAQSDSLREAGRALTTDAAGKKAGDDGFDPASRETFGFNAQADRQAIIGPFLSSNGATWEQDGKYVFASPEGIAAFDYLQKLINTDQIAPSAADTNQNGDFSRDLFVQGKLALFQSGPYSLLPIQQGAAEDLSWGIAPMVSGPNGAKSLVHGVTAVGNAQAPAEKQDAIAQLLTWLGSAEGQAPIGEMGVSFPGNKAAQQSFIDYWAEQGQDVNVFVEAAQDPAPADAATNAPAGLNAVMPIFQEIMAGRLSAAEGLQQAQDAGNEAMA